MLLSQFKEKTAKKKMKPLTVNFTAESFRKYDNVRIINLVKTLQAHGLPPADFAREVQSYFSYHAERKQNVIDVMKEQVLYQK